MSAGQAVFLVGGRGSRLGDLTLDTPKPLLPVGGRPFIEHLLDKAVREGFDDLVLLAGYRHEAIKAYAGEWSGVPLRLSIEPEPLDTAGAVAHAVSLLRDDALDALTLSSSEGLRNLLELLDTDSFDRLRALPVFVPHQRIAEEAARLGVHRVVLTGPADAGLVDGLCNYPWPDHER